MRFVFRADASPIHGAGHVMRCASIAETAQAAGYKTELVGEYQDVPWLAKSVTNGLFDSAKSISAGVTSREDVLIIDSYEISPSEDFIDLSKWKKVVCLLDNETPVYLADLYIGFHTTINTNQSKLIQNRKLVHGIRFNPVRKIHVENNQNRHVESNQLKIIVIGGGTDPWGFADSVISELSMVDTEFECSVMGIVNNPFPDDRFGQIAYGLDFSKKLEEVDLVITTAGTTIWELLTRKIAFGVACAATNQTENYEYLMNLGLAQPLGVRSELTGWNLDKSALLRLVQNKNSRRSLRENQNNTFAGDGANLIMEEILKILN